MQVEFVISVGICVSSLEEISASCRRAMEHFRHCHTADEDLILWENSAGDDGARSRTVMLAMEYLLLNYGRPELTLTEVCQHFGVSVTRFSANFKQQYGETFVEALSRIRMEEAKKLLRTTNLKNYGSPSVWDLQTHITLAWRLKRQRENRRRSGGRMMRGRRFFSSVSIKKTMTYAFLALVISAVLAFLLVSLSSTSAQSFGILFIMDSR